ncbi:DnaJ-class molecular chaperone with C-terminal Zn finger domain [Rivularia sp. PCC 7116]|uniref:dynamin family protein n=1 Tax=Rivularia sp. PCC 7116 TaxID=373994 RepID=UPI00029F0373|nr:dynamin family protein [Rivularia sp. PCC 7116]AFY57060.1 DnaJ-class molecular chaperone with C-terminal Zn finger domain [Rivularia sp. PCC 7116]
MPQNQIYQLLETLKSTAKLLNIESTSQLYRDIEAISHHLINPNFRIAVFGPFNHGKSTLLNALLGNKTLPIDLIPTTGAAITVKYGDELATLIKCIDGKQIHRSGTDILKEFAILDDDRRMRNDVASVEVFSPHPFLKTGVEFLDLPGTNDREEQNNLVKEQLLSADLVVQLLDARKLMTLEERENLRDWLLDRGIKTVIFVANFLNLLEPEEQKQVQSRLRFVAESFRSQLPPGFSNLYRVDALPALRARLKGDVSAANTSGLVAFEAALQNISATLKKDDNSISLPRIESIASQIQQSLKTKIIPLKNQVKEFDDKNQAKNEIKIKAETLIKQGFAQSLSELRNWLNINSLREKYQKQSATELANNNFQTWETNNLKQDFQKLKTDLNKWLEQAFDFFGQAKPEDLSIQFPPHPQIELTPPPNNSHNTSDTGAYAMAGGLGWLLGGPVGAAVGGGIAYLLDQGLQESSENTPEDYHQQLAQICIDAVDEYLLKLSRQGLSLLEEYEQEAKKVIKFIPTNQDCLEIAETRKTLNQYCNTLKSLNQQLEQALGITISSEFQIELDEKPCKSEYKETKVNTNQSKSVYSYSGKGVKEDVGTFKTSPPPKKEISKKEDVEKKFIDWEIDEEIAQMKSEMHSSGFKDNFKNRQQAKANQPLSDKQELINAYKIIGLKTDASPEQIKQAYKQLVKKWHPDLFINQPQKLIEAKDKIRLINEAYSLLTSNNHSHV